jgi:antitoxin (DNA-binding transcriptional repressor) of toxin-antitoxin stability system
MRFVTVREFRGKSAKIWSELAQEKEMVITSRGKPIAILSSVSGEKPGILPGRHSNRSGHGGG